jgi:hypothetical protein
VNKEKLFAGVVFAFSSFCFHIGKNDFKDMLDGMLEEELGDEFQLVSEPTMK